MRIVATADLHGALPNIPDCDVLIVAGDVAPDYGRPGNTEHSVRSQSGWLQKHFRAWLDTAPAGRILGIAGNHDFCLEASELEARDLPWTYLLDEGVEIDGVNFWGTPWVPNLSSWAFHLDDVRLESIYARIPDTVDVLISHGPPFGHCDHTVPKFGYVKAGSPEHTRALSRIRPLLNVCGHIHEGYGWALTAGDTLVANVAHQTENYEPINPPVTFWINDDDVAFEPSYRPATVPPKPHYPY